MVVHESANADAEEIQVSHQVAIWKMRGPEEGDFIWSTVTNLQRCVWWSGKRVTPSNLVHCMSIQDFMKAHALVESCGQTSGCDVVDSSVSRW